MGTDWRDGFLFVGNQLALDFLNTRPFMNGQPVELLADGGALARWLGAAALIPQAQAARLVRWWSTSKSGAALRELVDFRESLRKTVFKLEAGDALPSVFLADLNRRLAEYPATDRVVHEESGLARRTWFSPEVPEHAFAPLADAAAELLTNADRSRIRQCPNCVLHFYDTSKKGTRLWCSMNLCGNRAKVSAYAERKRAAIEQ